MKIAHVIDSMDIGGAEVMVQSLCRFHRAQGHDLSVHCLYGCGVLGDALRSEGIPVQVHGPARYEQLAFRVYAAFRHLAPDVVHCHNVVASVVGALPGRLTGARAVICTRHGIVAKPRNFRRQGLFWLTARGADRVVAVCGRAQTNLARATFSQPRKLITIWNGAAPAPIEAAAHRHESEPGETFNLITVARLGAPKDHVTLLHAFKTATARAPGLRLFVVGDGPNEPALRALAAQIGVGDAVRFLGARQDVGDWLARAHLFVLSSLSEGVPISLLEAMAAGLPCVVTDVGGMREIVDAGNSGVAVPVADAPALAEAILGYALNRQRWHEHGENARSAYASYFTLERMADAYMKLYRDPHLVHDQACPLPRPDSRIASRA